MRFLRCYLAVSLVALLGCFGDSTGPGVSVDASVALDAQGSVAEGGLDASAADAAVTDARGTVDSSDARSDASDAGVACSVVSTCPSVKSSSRAGSRAATAEPSRCRSPWTRERRTAASTGR